MKSFRFERDFAVVPTTEGPVRGFEQDGILSFRGIKYAQARRFHAPEPAPRHADVFDATSYGYVCPLLRQDEPKGELYVPHRFWPASEDCLNLNIWTPAADGARRPVLVWLHGGGYSAGSAIEQVAYDGHNMALYGDAVVVTINHRLNILGYFDLSDYGAEYENSGNAGGDDIIAALRWVRGNIEAFGGDPANVTVFGQSGGGGKVTTLLQSPEADGLYAKGFNMSGVLGLLGDSTGSGRELAEAMMARMGISTVQELERAPYPVLADAYNAVAPDMRKAGKYVGCAPHPNAHYAGEPVVNGFRKETQHIPLLVGSVYGEFTSFGPAPFDKHSMSEAEQRALIAKYTGEAAADSLIALYKQSYPERLTADLIRIDTMFRPAIIEYVKARAAVNGSVYSYMFNMDQPIYGGLTPWHCSDIPYVFRNIDLVEYPNGSADAAAVQRNVFDSVMAFARTGDPSHAGLPAWPACTPESENTMIIDAESRCAANHDHALIAAAVGSIAPKMGDIMRDLSGQPQH